MRRQSKGYDWYAPLYGGHYGNMVVLYAPVDCPSNCFWIIPGTINPAT